MQIETINGREYQVEQLPARHDRLKADMISRGWDGHSYLLTGKRGATYIAFRSARTSALSIVTSI